MGTMPPVQVPRSGLPSSGSQYLHLYLHIRCGLSHGQDTIRHSMTVSLA